MCDPITFENITPDRFTALQQKAASAAGIAISGDTGEASADGVTIQWNYDPASERLTMQCTDKPMFVPCSLINAKIGSMAEQ
jgi:hypothetical protein